MIAPPIFAVEANDVTWFDDTQRAASWMEAQDVEDGVYRVLDSEGKELEVAVNLGRVVITDTVVGAAPDYLRDRMRSYLGQVSPDRRRLSNEGLADASLSDLVTAFCEVEKSR